MWVLAPFLVELGRGVGGSSSTCKGGLLQCRGGSLECEYHRRDCVLMGACQSPAPGCGAGQPHQHVGQDKLFARNRPEGFVCLGRSRLMWALAWKGTPGSPGQLAHCSTASPPGSKPCHQQRTEASYSQQQQHGEESPRPAFLGIAGSEGPQAPGMRKSRGREDAVA